MRSQKRTIFGKCRIVNSLILSKIVNHEKVLEKKTKLNLFFIWGKRDRTKRHMLIRAIKDKGIGIIDPEIKPVKAARVSKLAK